jgi:hypothetical protein
VSPWNRNRDRISVSLAQSPSAGLPPAPARVTVSESGQISQAHYRVVAGTNIAARARCRLTTTGTEYALVSRRVSVEAI